MDLILKNCRLTGKNGDYFIGIKEGKIEEISRTPLKDGEAIDIKGNYVMPGFIDPHVHFRDPGLTYKEDFKSGSLSAANGGFTTVIDMPNTKPVTDTYKTLKEKMEIAERKSVTNYELQAGVNSLEEMEKMMELEPVAFKIFMDLKEDWELEETFKNLAILKEKTSYSGLVATHCENRKIVKEESERLKQKENQKAIDYSYGRPAEAEDTSVRQAIELAVKNNLKLHICHLSSRKSLELAKNSSGDISWEFTPHHILLNNDSYNDFGTIVKTNPPLRPENESIQISDIDENTIIGTDHAPHSLEEKNRGVWDSSPGIPNLETVVPLLLSEVNKNRLSLDLIPKILSQNAAERFGLENKGEIAVGKDADLTVIDLKRKGKFNIDSFETKAEYSPFENQEYIGKSVITIVNGKIAVNNL